MSINSRLIAGSILFALLTAGFAGFSFYLQRSSIDQVAQLYDRSVEPMLALQAAETRVAALHARLADDGGIASPDREPGLGARDAEDFRRTLAGTVADLESVLAAGIAPDDHETVSTLFYRLTRLQATSGNLSPRLARTQLADISDRLSGVAAAMRAERDAERKDAEARIYGAIAGNLAGLAAVLLGLGGLLLVLARAVGRPLRRLSQLAGALAAGETVDPIRPDGPTEVQDVLQALRAMQARCARLEGAMTSETGFLAGQIAMQQTQLEAALNNMTQALCMLDGEKRLVVCNDGFTQLFGNVEPGTPARAFFDDSEFALQLPENGTAIHLHETLDGRTMEVKRRGMKGRGLLITFEDITERQAISNRLEQLANHDGLTDLLNRRRFSEVLDGLLGKGLKPLGLVVVDISSFKSINDNYGHGAGDALLRAFAQRLCAIATPRATVARLGGDEFAVILPGLNSPEDADALAQSIVGSFAQPFEVENRRIAAAAHAGVLFVPGGYRMPGLDADFALQNCDLALNHAKESGRRRPCRRFVPAMRERLQRRREMELDLKAALENDQIELFYQPFIDAGQRRVSGFEALLRWRHPGQGTIAPSVFIPLAEETGLIEQLGIWALDKACHEAARWPADLAISVNLSAVQFQSATLLADVRKVLAESGLAASRLQIEVTESLFIDESDTVLSILIEFRRMGMTISMDDFGTGYSSLGYLSRFPFDKIKIDQSFVRDMRRPENIAIVRSVIGLSKALRMQVIAEGIETEEQMQILYAEGCREMQGYYFSRPRHAAEIPQILSDIKSRWDRDLVQAGELRAVVAA
ncbi:bifunctional diguanylate cyclase/phosphodiesterase [Aurantimonas sp. HBX-1]|uniref:putative bifunctional diguanylate cyclase/phosphodiesterase n=1 Tax=Aurantimonas sp. HBX-1 TaxID=2906072 RepID=UPI001F174A44|nr:EAL domain-containing protein [Aurantimonas sp. HBX-1]UIJ72836.1 EAL domain-containing protein [Aurantimonas sp. HBX-1]